MPIAIAYAFVEYKLSAIPNSYNQKRSFFEARMDRISILSLGTSHIYYGVNPDYFSLYGFNLSNTDQSLYYDKRLTLKYIDKMPRLKIVIIEVCYFSLYYQLRNNPVENWRDYFYSQFWGINYKDLPLWDMKRYSKIALYTPDKVKEFNRSGFHVNLAGNMDGNGYMRLDTSKTGENEKLNAAEGKTKMELWRKLIDTTQYGYIYNDLAAFVKELKNRKIEVIFINAPVLPFISDLCDTAIFNKNNQSIANLCNTYHCKYFNYFTDTRFARKEFIDVDHLNMAGAAHFSEIINNEIIMPLMTLNSY